MKASKNTLAAAIRTILMSAPGFAITAVCAQNAQQPAQSQQNQTTDDLQEITIYSKAIHYRPDDESTATGLKMQIVDAPVSISVMTDEMLKADNASTVYDVADLVPGLNQAGQGFGSDKMLLRGQQVTEPRINDINYGTAQFVDAFALDRVEIVRGPATVLYGITGAFGGEVNQVLKQPKDEFHAEIGYQNGDFAKRRWQADVTGAVPGTDDRLKVRVVGAYTNYGIFQDISDPPHNINKMLMTAVEYDFTPNTIGSVYTYKEDRHFDATDGCPAAYNKATNTLYFPFSIPVDQFYCGNPEQNHTARTDEFSEASLKHTFANHWYFNVNTAYAKSIRQLQYVYGFGPAGSGSLPPQDIYLYSYQQRVDDTTMTANASLGGKFDLFERTQEFFTALEYQKEIYRDVPYQSNYLGIMNMFQDGGKGILTNGSPIPLYNGVIPNYSVALSESRALRESLQMLFNLADRLDMLAGALVQHTDVSDETTDYTSTTVTPYPGAILKETDLVKRFGVTYGLLPEKGELLTTAKTYFSYSEGFQPNVGVFGPGGVPLTAPQRMKSYELGLKTQLNNSNIDADLALYHATLENIPAVNFTPTNGIYSSALSGLNTYDGVEFELLGQVKPGWNASLNYTYARALEQTPLFPQRLGISNVPKHDIGLLNSYEFLGGSLKGLLVSATVIRKIDTPLFDNAQAIFANNYNPSNQDFISTTIVNFRASYKGFHDRAKGLEVYGTVNNAFNAKYAYSINNEASLTNTVLPPRAMSVGVNYKY